MVKTRPTALGDECLGRRIEIYTLEMERISRIGDLLNEIRENGETSGDGNIIVKFGGKI
jgi:hypothetical protein